MNKFKHLVKRRNAAVEVFRRAQNDLANLAGALREECGLAAVRRIEAEEDEAFLAKELLQVTETHNNLCVLTGNEPEL